MRYIQNCETCRRSKAVCYVPYGVLKPLPVPDHPWEDILVDFVVGLPEAEWFDWLTKMRHFIACNKTANLRDVSQMFLDNLCHLHGLVKSIVFDIEPQFLSCFWKVLFTLLEIEPRLLSVFHPETFTDTR